MRDVAMAMAAAVLGVLLAISFGVFLMIVLHLETAALIATAGAFLLVFALGVYAGVRWVLANIEMDHGALSNDRPMLGHGWMHSRSDKAA